MFDNPEDLQEAISEYFNKGVKKRKMVVGKGKNAKTISIPCPTITGLAHYLGFESRQSFYDYGNKPDFTYTVKRAHLFIEVEYEEQLTYGNTVGAIFALKNMGWADKQEISQTVETTVSDTQFKLSRRKQK